MEESPINKRRIRLLAVKDLLVLGLAFVLNFTAYQGLASLQSSFNSDGGLGTAGLAATYASVVASSLAISPLVIGRLGPKLTMTAMLIGYLAYCCLNFYPAWATIIPGSVIIGVCGAPLWAAMSVYTVKVARVYADACEPKRDAGDVVPVFFGIFFTLVTSCNIWGNLISFLSLSDNSSFSTALAANYTCGYRFCSGSGDAGAAQKPPMYKFYIMNGCFAAVSALSIITTATLVSRYDTAADRQPVSLQQLRSNFSSMGRHLLNAKQLLLIPLTMNVGLSQSFAFGEFTEAFIACSAGIPAIGRVMMVYGATQVVSGSISGAAAGKFGKMPVLLIAAATQLTLETLALFWEVTPEPAWQLYAFAAVWGAVDTVWNSQMNALYGQFFTESQDAAFSAYRVWESCGYIIGFSYNKLLCTQQKLFVMLSVAALGAFGLVVAHFCFNGRNVVFEAEIGDARDGERQKSLTR